MKSINLLRTLAVLFILLTAFSSCKKDDDEDIGEVIIENPEYMPGNGIFIINEGTFLSGNGSIDFMNTDKGIMYKNIYYTVNKVALGDIPLEMKIYENKAYIVVNNSGKINIVDMENFEQITSIEGLNQPRRFLKVNSSKAYISSLAEPSLFIMDLSTNTINGTVQTQKSCENLLLFNDVVYATNWSNWYVQEENNTVQIIDVNTDQKIKDIVVNKEPNSIVIDKNNIIWVLCSGGFMGEEIPALCKIDPLSQQLIETIAFPDTNMSPSKLCINGNGDELFFLNNGIFRMNITENSIPQQVLVPQENSFFYGLFIDPVDSRIYASDARDFASSGVVFIYDKDGNYEGSRISGIVPGDFSYSQ